MTEKCKLNDLAKDLGVAQVKVVANKVRMTE